MNAPEMFNAIVNPKLLGAVSSILESEEIVASSVYRIRSKLPEIAQDDVPWHQDRGYYAEHCYDKLIVTCWVPLVNATVENGCMQILPKTHRGQLALHYAGGNSGFLVINDEDLPADPQQAIAANVRWGEWSS
jgi:phytanoyl-CoA hydroxylase